MVDRQYHSAESLGLSSTTSTSDQAKTSISFTPDANRDYMFLGGITKSSLAGGNTNRCYPRGVNSSGTQQSYACSEASKAGSTDQHGAGGLMVFSAGASPSAETFYQYFRVLGSTTAYVRNATQIALRLESNDEFISVTTDYSTTSATWSDVGSGLTFTPPSTGDYLILACCTTQYDGNTQLRTFGTRLDIDGTTYREELHHIYSANSGNRQNTHVHAMVVNLDATEHNIVWQFQENSSYTLTFRDHVIVALRLDDFPDYEYDQSESSQGTTSSSYGDSDCSLTITPENEDHLIISTATIGCGAGGASGDCFAKLDRIGTDVGEAMAIGNLNSDFRRPAALNFSVDELAASSQTFKHQWKETGGRTGYIDHKTIAVLQLVATAAPEINVKEGAVNIADGETTPRDYGTATVGDAALTKTFTIENTDTGTLTISTVTLPSGYQLGSGNQVTNGTTIAASSSKSLIVELPTSSAGAFSGDISLANDDADENPYNWAITGTINAASSYSSKRKSRARYPFSSVRCCRRRSRRRR